MLIVRDCMKVPLPASVDVSNAGALRAHLARLERGGCRKIMLDFAGTEFVDSAGVAMVLMLTRSMRAHGGVVSLTNVGPRVMHTLALGKLTDFIPVTAAPVPANVPRLPAGELAQKRVTMAVTLETLAANRARLEGIFHELGMSSEESFDLVLAAGEAMGNAVDHAPGAPAFLTVSVYSDRVVMELVDAGPGFELASGQELPTYLDRGRGIKMMRMLTDKVEIARRVGAPGTQVTLTKMRSSW
jgi:anti-anti-sigma factor